MTAFRLKQQDWSGTRGISTADDTLLDRAVRRTISREFRAAGGESPFYDENLNAVVSVDTVGQRVILHPLDGSPGTLWELPEPVGFAVPNISGRYILGLASGLHTMDPSSGDIAALPNIHLTGRPNDATVDAAGRLIVGTRGSDGELDGEIVSIDRHHQTRKLLDGFGLVNGLAFSVKQRALFLADTTTEVVWRCDYDLRTGEIGKPKVIFKFLDRLGRPDGAATDAEGNLWIAVTGGACLVKLSDSGMLLDEISLAVSKPTKLCFLPGNQIVVTSSSRNVDVSSEPDCGRLIFLPMAGPANVLGVADV